jgi:hypothetical protein
MAAADCLLVIDHLLVVTAQQLGNMDCHLIENQPERPPDDASDCAFDDYDEAFNLHSSSLSSARESSRDSRRPWGVLGFAESDFWAHAAVVDMRLCGGCFTAIVAPDGTLLGERKQTMDSRGHYSRPELLSL